MPITKMCDLKTAEAAIAAGDPDYFLIRDYPGAEEGRVSHHKSYGKSDWDSGITCPHYGGGHSEFFGSGPLRPECAEAGCRRFGPLAMHTTHRGMVLSADGERNGRDDSDFYAKVWNGERVIEVTFASTRGWTYPNHAEADAGPEVVAAYKTWVAECERAYRARQAEAEAKTPRVGKTLKVVRGRKVPQGTVGECIWVGADAYRRGKMRVGLKTAAGEKFFTSADNVAVVL